MIIILIITCTIHYYIAPANIFRYSVSFASIQLNLLTDAETRLIYHKILLCTYTVTTVKEILLDVRVAEARVSLSP